MRNIGFFSLLTIFLFSNTFAQVTDSDRLFKMATDFVKERRYSDAVSIFKSWQKMMSTMPSTIWLFDKYR